MFMYLFYKCFSITFYFISSLSQFLSALLFEISLAVAWPLGAFRDQGRMFCKVLKPHELL